MNILFFYNSTQTYTNTVYEHLWAFSRYSKNQFFFCHHDDKHPFREDLSKFGAVFIHYSIRLPFDQVEPKTVERLAAFKGLKVLFIQDEYDNTYKTWNWIKRIGFNLIFTVVPEENISKVYPPDEFPGVVFVNNLTGYVPECLPTNISIDSPSKRSITVGYRGRTLPVHYGKLCMEKFEIGKVVRSYCEAKQIHHDIAWDENSRIYGEDWYKFIASCRSMLGSESGSNVFNWDGSLGKRISDFKNTNPSATDAEVYDSIIEKYEIPGMMNQVSPRVFESIMLRTVLVLYEGKYSGVVEPWKHFLPLKKDGSNLDEIFAFLKDDGKVDEMAERAYQDVIKSNKYSYKTFIEKVDNELENFVTQIPIMLSEKVIESSTEEINPNMLTLIPIRYRINMPSSMLREAIYGLVHSNYIFLRRIVKLSLKKLKLIKWLILFIYG